MNRFTRLAFVFYLLLAIAGLVTLALLGRPIDLALFVHAERAATDFGLGVAVGLALVALWAGARRLLPSVRAVDAELGAIVGPLGRDEALALAFVSALAEEVAFRGAAQQGLGWIEATLLFALVHVGPGLRFLPWTLFALTGGVAFAQLVVQRGALLPAIAAHFTVNAIELLRIARRPGPIRAAPPTA